MQFVQKRAQKSTNIVLGCEVVALTTSIPVDFVQKLAYNWLLRFCGFRPGYKSFTILVLLELPTQPLCQADGAN